MRSINHHESMGGFTLIETILVLMLLGVLATVAVSNIDTTTSQLDARVEAVKGHLRYAQVRALNSSESWSINFTATGYSLFHGGNPANKVLLPGETAQDVDLAASGIGVSTPGVVSFDSFGGPCTDNAGAVRQAGARALTLSKGGKSSGLTIAEETGYIP